MMEINKQAAGNELTIALKGRLDTTTSPTLEAELSTCLDGIQHLVFDMTALEYISSAGLRVLLTAQKRMNTQGDLVLRHVNEAVMDILDVTGFVDILRVE